MFMVTEKHLCINIFLEKYRFLKRSLQFSSTVYVYTSNTFKILAPLVLNIEGRISFEQLFLEYFQNYKTQNFVKHSF